MASSVSAVYELPQLAATGTTGCGMASRLAASAARSASLSMASCLAVASLAASAFTSSSSSIMKREATDSRIRGRRPSEIPVACPWLAAEEGSRGHVARAKGRLCGRVVDAIPDGIHREARCGRLCGEQVPRGAVAGASLGFLLSPPFPPSCVIQSCSVGLCDFNIIKASHS